jgi:1-acyl-sn-glycerol-3-phosphate acyltransferase
MMDDRLGKGGNGAVVPAALDARIAAGLAFLRRRLAGQYDIDEFGFDPDLTSNVLLPLIRPLAEKYFRAEVRGVENVPSDGAALIVANHAGTIPIDALVTQLLIHDRTGRHLRLLAADLVFRLPVTGHLARKAGHTLACQEDTARLLEAGEVVGVWPEGFKGIGKPFNQRYQLQRFGRGGFVTAAAKAGAKIVPCAIVGAEEIYPIIADVKPLAKMLGLPYVPVTPTFPWLGPLGLLPLPSKWLVEFGPPIESSDLPEAAEDDPLSVLDMTSQVRETIQHMIYRLLAQRGSAYG